MTRLLLPIALLLSLVGCERSPEPAAPAIDVATPPAPAPAATVVPAELQARAIRFTLKDTTGCDDRCARFEADWLDFPQQPALNRLVLDHVSAPEADSTKSALTRQGREFLRDAMEAQEPWEQIFKVNMIPGLGDVSVIEVVAYSYTGGAHGMTTISTLNFDRATNQVLSLSDIIQPERESQFWQIARRAHEQWINAQDDPASFDGWPFVPTSTFLLTPDALQLQYDPYAIGPYSMGSPLINIAYERLQDVLRREFLPER